MSVNLTTLESSLRNDGERHREEDRIQVRCRPHSASGCIQVRNNRALVNLLLTILSMVQMITVTVGEAGIQYPIHESVVCKTSTFFDNAMKPEWASARPDPRRVDLSDEEPDIFSIYIHWLYFKTIPSVVTEVEPARNPEYELLAKCYVM
jgi:hypothetical protein